MNELISVVVCCYNPDVSKLKNTIKSIVNQKDVDTEIIIADDGSSLEYKDELDKWAKQQKIELIYSFNDSNKGTVINILNALEKCKGLYVKDISPGDYLHDEFTLKTYYEAMKNSNCDIVYGDATYYFENEIIFKKHYPKSNSTFNPKIFAKYYCLTSNFFVGAAFFIRKEIYYSCLSKIKGYSILSEDFSTICISIMEGYKFFGLKQSMIWYEYGVGISTGNKTNERLVKDVDNIFEYIYEHYPCNRLAKRMYRRYKLNEYHTLKKYIYNLVFFPDCVVRKILDAFYKPVNYDASIDAMYRIIK